MIIRKFTLILGVLVACPAPAQAFDSAAAGKAMWQSAQDFASRLTSSFSSGKISKKTMAIIALGAAGVLAAIFVHRALNTRVYAQPLSVILQESVAHITPDLLKGDANKLRQACVNTYKGALNSGVRDKKIESCIDTFISDKSIPLHAVFITMRYLSGNMKYVAAEYSKKLQTIMQKVSAEDVASLLQAAHKDDIEDFCYIIRSTCDLQTRKEIAQKVAPARAERTAVSDEHKSKTATTLTALFYNYKRDGEPNKVLRDLHGNAVSINDEDREYNAVTIAWQQPPVY